MRIEIIGGDERMLRLAALLEQRGELVTTLGLRPEDDQTCPSRRAEVLLLPYPFSVWDGNVPCLTGLKLRADEVLARAEDSTLILTGRGFSPYLAASKALGRCLRWRAWDEDGPLLNENTELSAEGALSFAMQKGPAALWRSHGLITGYGRLARALARRLVALGAYVTVAARREEACQQAQDDGMHACMLEELTAEARGMDWVFNTIPARVLSGDVLRALPSHAYLYELASAPYGFDEAQALALGLRAFRLPAIPARYAPESAARALGEAADRLLSALKGEKR